MGNAALDHDNCPDPALDSPPSATHVRQNLSKLKLVSLQAQGPDYEPTRLLN